MFENKLRRRVNVTKKFPRYKNSCFSCGDHHPPDVHGISRSSKVTNRTWANQMWIKLLPTKTASKWHNSMWYLSDALTVIERSFIETVFFESFQHPYFCFSELGFFHRDDVSFSRHVSSLNECTDFWHNVMVVLFQLLLLCAEETVWIYLYFTTNCRALHHRIFFWKPSHHYISMKFMWRTCKDWALWVRKVQFISRIRSPSQFISVSVEMSRWNRMGTTEDRR